MHRLTRHPVAAGDIDHRGAIEHLAHRRIALLHQAQLHEHDGLLRNLWTRTTTAKEEATSPRWTPQNPRSVTQVPEPLSPTSRDRVPEVSPRSRSQRVKHVPGSHIAPVGRLRMAKRWPTTVPASLEKGCSAT